MLQPGTIDENVRKYINEVMLKDQTCNVIESCVLKEFGELYGAISTSASGRWPIARSRF